MEQVAREALTLDPGNGDATALIDSARSMLEDASGTSLPAVEGEEPALSPSKDDPSTEGPTSFANGRYQVSKFLGEGGKKRVFQAHDTLLDREVAFALIKTEGFDQTSKERISREAQAMGRLGVHPNIVAVLDLGQEDDGTSYMVTELMGGGDVEGLLEKTTPEPPPDSGGGKLRPPPSEGGGLEVGRDLAN
ncbi:MAG: protein kinase, partial [Chloroflexi bacterium]|nr:protein kinase [Chloroflexota bacterium]